MSNIQLILIKNKVQYDISQLVSSVKWSGKKGSAPRTLDFTLINDKNFQTAGIDIEDGHTCIFKYAGKELFRGIILKQSENASGKKASYKAYDLGIYLSNNKDTLTFKNKRADQIFKSICKKYGIKTGTVVNTGYVIAEHIQSKKKIWDCLLSALAKTYKHTGKRYYIRSDKGTLSLLRRAEDMVDIIAETGGNMLDYKRTKSFEKIVTRIVCYNDDNKLVASAKNSGLEKKIGIFQDEVSYDDEKNTAQLKKLCSTILNEKSKISHTLTLTLIGNVNFISGRCLNVIIKPLGISRKFYIDSDTHTFDYNGTYKTQLSLNIFNEKEWKESDEDE